jgi:hypothetical protein
MAQKKYRTLRPLAIGGRVEAGETIVLDEEAAAAYAPGFIEEIVEPAAPVEPEAPVVSTEPAAPVEPTAPVEPASTEAPAAPVEPEE